MIRFECDYSEGCIAKIQQALMATNLEQTSGYGMDEHCERARSIIRKLCCREDAEVQFLVGGTQANMTMVAAALRAHQGVLAAETGHVNVHESGAIEATGHKVLALPAADGAGTDLAAQQAVGLLQLFIDKRGGSAVCQIFQTNRSFAQRNVLRIHNPIYMFEDMIAYSVLNFNTFLDFFYILQIWIMLHRRSSVSVLFNV